MAMPCVPSYAFWPLPFSQTALRPDLPDARLPACLCRIFMVCLSYTDDRRWCDAVDRGMPGLRGGAAGRCTGRSVLPRSLAPDRQTDRPRKHRRGWSRTSPTRYVLEYSIETTMREGGQWCALVVAAALLLVGLCIRYRTYVLKVHSTMFYEVILHTFPLVWCVCQGASTVVCSPVQGA